MQSSPWRPAAPTVRLPRVRRWPALTARSGFRFAATTPTHRGSCVGYAAGWLHRVSDPGVLLGLAQLPVHGVHAARDSAAASATAVTIVCRSSGALLPAPSTDRAGLARAPHRHRRRSYLDMVNNVAVLGHGRPELADAVARQWRRHPLSSCALQLRLWWHFQSAWPRPCPTHWTPCFW